MKYTSRADLLIAAGESIKMQLNSGMDNPEGKLNGRIEYLNNAHFFHGNWEFPLAVVEGKPVFVGDELYNLGSGAKLSAMHVHPTCWDQFSWNPPKPKTVMVELPIATAEWYANNKYSEAYQPYFVSEACRKALEKA